MSAEQAKEFLARVDSDDAVRASVQDAYTEQLVRVATGLGYDVSADDLKAATSEMTDLGDELSLSDLESVAGGGTRFRGPGGLGVDSVR
ncbi:MAG TPA: Nif11-like leader peptide family RiPP precursor [Acidimicrobiales bacterium]